MKYFWAIFLIGWLTLSFHPLQAQDNLNLVIADTLRIKVGESDILRTVKWSPNGHYLAVGGGGGVWLFDTRFEQVAHFNTQFTDVVSVDWSPDSSRIAIFTLLNEHAVIVIINIRTGNNFVITPPGAGIISPLRWSPDGAFIVVGNYDRETLVFDAVTGDIVFRFQAPSDAHQDYSNFAYGYCWLENGQRLVAVYNEQLFIFAMPNEEPITQFDTITSSSVDCSPDGAVVMGALGKVVDLATGETTVFAIGDGVAISWHPSGNYFAINMLENKVRIWSSDGQHLLAELEGGIDNGGGPIFYDDSIAWHPDGELLAAVGEDNILRIWRVVEE